MIRRTQAFAQRRASLPLALLIALSVLSLGARVAWLGAPCRSPCGAAADHVLIFDENYYINAARVIAGVRPAAGARYAGSPLGMDPNAEHPQLAKVLIAGSIELFGDGPLAWRLGSVLLGSLAILGLFVLVRSAGGSRWLALGAATMIALDNLALVHGRIGTLDVYALTAMIWGVAFYLRGRPLLAGALIGVGASCKLVVPYALLVLALYEGLRLVANRTGGSRMTAERVGGKRALARLGGCAFTAAGVFLALLAALDRIAPPWNASAGQRISGGALHHIAHMLSFAAHQTSPHGPRGIASYPWEWIADVKPIVYLTVNPARPTAGLYHVHPAVHFLGMVSPPIMLLAVPALIYAATRVLRRSAHHLELLGLAWLIGAFVPFELLSLLWSRTSYLYYMLIVMPAIYILIVQMLATVRPPRIAVGIWAATVVLAAVIMYPLTPLP